MQTKNLAGWERNIYSGNLSNRPSTEYAPLLGSGPILYVSKTGSDSNTGTSLEQAFLTIEKAMLTIASGGTIMVFSNGGVLTEYSDLAANVAPFGTSYSGTSPYGGDIRSVIIPRISGTLGNNCTIMAAPGHEGLVQITGSNYVMGMHMNNKSYWTVWGLRFVGCFKHGIFNPEANTKVNEPAAQIIANDTKVSFGCIIENCLFKDIYTDNIAYSGVDNCAAISPWGSKYWTIRNCKIKNIFDIDPTKINSAIQLYSGANLLIERCDIDASRGVFMKDHWLKIVSPRTPYDLEAEIRYCRFNTVYSAFYIGNQGNDTPESGGQSFHHNICKTNYSSSVQPTVDGGCFVSARQIYSLAGLQATNIAVYSNIFDGSASTSMRGFDFSGWENISSKGNIIIADDFFYFCSSPASGSLSPLNEIKVSNENLFVASVFKMKLQKYAPDENQFTNFATWQALTIGAPNTRTLQVNNPDSHSQFLTSTAGMFVDLANGNYTAAGGSLITGFMQDGSNVGAYQLGTETIGLLPVYSAGS